jgi:hypothetical protein
LRSIGLADSLISYARGARRVLKSVRQSVTHALSMILYKDLTPKPIKLPPLHKGAYVRPPISDQTFVPERY